MRKSLKIPKIHHWNYRVVKSEYPEFPDSPTFSIYEVYYDGENRILSWTTDSEEAQGETVKDLKKDLLLMAKACSQPVLKIKLFRGKEKLVEYNQK